MRSLSEAEFKQYVVKKAKEYLFGSTESPLNEGVEAITPDAVKQLVDEMKKANSTFSLNFSLAEPKPLEESRKFKVGSYEHPTIELKDTLQETMNNYNNKKSLRNGDEKDVDSFKRLTNYKKFSEKG